MKGSVLVVSGPSGSGKSSLLSRAFKQTENFYFSISTTTRSIREGEVDGVNYHFASVEDFKLGIENNQFLEWAEVHGNYYGTSIFPVEKALSEGKLVIFDIDVQGFHSIKHRLGGIVTSVFITTPHISILEQRLRARQTDTDEVIEKRLLNAITEMNYIQDYDSVIVNEDLAKSSIELLSAIKYAQSKHNIDLLDFVASWKKR